MPFAVYNYVEPDISVICDRDKLDNKGCHGAPEFHSSQERVKADMYEDFEIHFSEYLEEMKEINKSGQ